MKFSVAGSKIVCSRVDNTAEGTDTYRRVAQFDAHLDAIPPHVAARLTQGEIDELEQFLVDRKRIQANPAEKNMLEALPVLLQEAVEALESVDGINKSMHKQLTTSINRLQAALSRVNPQSQGCRTPVKKMRESEALKERLENIKQEL
jgi:hypothetical protein